MRCVSCPSFLQMSTDFSMLPNNADRPSRSQTSVPPLPSKVSVDLDWLGCTAVRLKFHAYVFLVSQPYRWRSFCKPRLAALPLLVGRCSQSGLISGNGGFKDRRKRSVCSEMTRILDNLFCLSCSPILKGTRNSVSLGFWNATRRHRGASETGNGRASTEREKDEGWTSRGCSQSGPNAVLDECLPVVTMTQYCTVPDTTISHTFASVRTHGHHGPQSGFLSLCDTPRA